MLRKIYLQNEYPERIREDAIRASRELIPKEVFGYLSGEYFPEDDIILFSEIHPIGKKLGTKSPIANIIDHFFISLSSRKIKEYMRRIHYKLPHMLNEGKLPGWGVYHSHKGSSGWSQDDLQYIGKPSRIGAKRKYEEAHILYSVGDDQFRARNRKNEPISIQLPNGEYVSKVQT